MTKNKKPRNAEAEHDDETPEYKPEEKSAETPAAHPKQGTTYTVSGTEVTFEGERHLKASPTSGVQAGVYTIVSTILKPGNRKVYRAVVGEQLYPIREYDTADEIISKIRSESKEPRKPRKGSVPKAALRDSDDGDSIQLSDAAVEILRDYLTLRHEEDREGLVSELIVKHLGPEVERLKAAQEAISKLPVDLLTALANASDETRQKILASLR